MFTKLLIILLYLSMDIDSKEVRPSRVHFVNNHAFIFTLQMNVNVGERAFYTFKLRLLEYR